MIFDTEQLFSATVAGSGVDAAGSGLVAVSGSEATSFKSDAAVGDGSYE